MALPDAVVGGTRPSPLITWTDLDGDALDLTGALLSGVLIDEHGNNQAIAGTLTVTDATNGVFRWDYSAGDVARAGTYLVQFSAAYGSSPTPAKTFREKWRVRP